MTPDAEGWRAALTPAVREALQNLDAVRAQRDGLLAAVERLRDAYLVTVEGGRATVTVTPDAEEMLTAWHAVIHAIADARRVA